MATTARGNVAAATQTGASAQELNGTAAALQTAVARFVLTRSGAGSSNQTTKQKQTGQRPSRRDGSSDPSHASDDALATAGSHS
jgi:hypothetical protein